MSTDSYVNTFAIISFPKENEKSDVKYEYFIPKSIAQNYANNRGLNGIETETINEDALKKVYDNEETKNFWLMKNKDDMSVLSAEFLEDFQISDAFYGPVNSLSEIMSFLTKANIDPRDVKGL